MKIKAKRLVSIAITLMMILSCVSVVQAAELVFPDLISDNMLVQRDMPIKLWAMGGTPGDTIKVVILNDSKKAVSEGSAEIGADGWSIELPAIEEGGPYTIYFKNKNGLDLKIVNNVLCGELWYQGGQSNMAMSINEIPEDVPERVTPNPQSDEIRLFMNKILMSSKTEEKNIAGSWEIVSTNTQGYSAVGYQALEDIHNALGGDIPVGGICTPYGGSDLYELSVGGKYHNAKIAPVTNMNVRGVMWYQGEADREKTVELYTERLNTFVSGLRKAWRNSELPFVFVQLPQSQFKSPIWGDEENFEISDYSRVRVAQSNFAVKDENIYQAVTVDLSCSNYMDRGEESAHPWLKKPVGQRLALAVLDGIYGIVETGNSPIYSGFAVSGDSIIVTVEDAYDGLKTTDDKAPRGFMIAGEDGVYYEADATLSGNTITLKSSNVPSPVHASYAFERHYWPYADKLDVTNAPDRGDDILDLNVVNSAGLPLGTFATEVSLATATVTVPDGGESQETPEPFQPSAPVEVATVGESGNKTVLYVATDGKDTNDGSYSKPFATMTKARDTIRELKKAGKLAEDGAVVYVRGGNYYKNDCTVLSAEDSGTKDAPIVYRNYPGEEVNFIGGAQLDWSNFVKTTDEAVLNRIVDEKAREHIMEVDLKALGYTEFPELPLPGSFSYDHKMSTIIGNTRPWAAGPELIVNGKGMTIARYPNEGFFNIDEVIEPGACTLYWTDEFIGKAEYVPPEKQIPTPFTIGIYDERLSKWGQVDDAMIFGYFYYSWGDQTVPVASIDTEELTITSKYPSCYSVRADQMAYVYNLLEEIDIPGEFFLDRKSGKLYYYPIDEKHETIYYTTNDYYMIELNKCENVTIKGIKMKYTQSGAVYFNGAKNCELIDCDIEATGYQSVLLENCENIGIYDCNFYNVEGGIDIKNCGDRQTLTPGNCVVENCIFQACDRITKTYKQAVKLSGGVGNYVINNKMFDSDHNIMQFSGNNHVMAFNEISEACQYTDDMGAIYAGRNLTCRGNIIAHNYFHDIETKETVGGQGVHAIFLDDFFSAADMYGNVFEKCNGSSVTMFAGSHNKLYNNAFINCTGKSAYMMTSFTYGGSALTEADFLPGIRAVPYMSEVWLSQYPSIANVINEEGILDTCRDITVTNNILYKTPTHQASSEILETATIENNVIFSKDPGFMDLENGKYMLKEDAEAFTQIEGFKPLLFTRMGHYRDRATNRVKDAFVYCLDSPYMFKKGEKVKEDNGIKVIDGTIYLPIRSGAEAVDAEVGYDDATAEVSVSVASKIVKFPSGDGVTQVNINGQNVDLTKAIAHSDDTNYIALQDLATIFGKYIIQENNLVIISDTAELFDEENDKNIVRYLESEISIY